MKKITTAICLGLMFIAANFAVAKNADNPNTVKIKSEYVYKGETKAVIITPKNYEQNKSERYPVIYILHGCGDTEQKWIKEKPELQQISDNLNVIFVCPDGKTSWYWDCPNKPEYKYESYISKALVNYVDSNYRTIASPKFRAITGLSMGGHGALWNGLRHPDVFGACGSMSGGVDIRPFPNNWDMPKNLGEYESNKDVWDNHTVINLVENLKPNTSKIIIDCGVSDFFFKVNKNLHEKLLKHKIPHDYIVRPGSHSWSYWVNSIEYQILFFNNFFKDNMKNLQK